MRKDRSMFYRPPCDVVIASGEQPRVISRVRIKTGPLDQMLERVKTARLTRNQSELTQPPEEPAPVPEGAPVFTYPVPRPEVVGQTALDAWG